MTTANEARGRTNQAIELTYAVFLDGAFRRIKEACLRCDYYCIIDIPTVSGEDYMTLVAYFEEQGFRLRHQYSRDDYARFDCNWRT
jgi:hypothetical protein